MTKILPNNARLHAAEQIIESITEPANSVYYVFVADHTDHSNSELQPLYDNHRMIGIEAYRNMIYGKRVESPDVMMMIPNIPYVSNTVYTMYDDTDEDMFTSSFYAVVNATSWYHVYKCLDNNDGAPSTIEPDISHISGSNTFLYQTSDGYKWKYMYSVDSANNTKFATDEFFPVIANASVTSLCVDGAIDIIRITGEGRGYDNYVSGTFGGADLRVNGDPLLFGISNNTTSISNGFYTGCLLYVASGTGSGQYRTITNYYSNSTGNYAEVDGPFNPILAIDSEYQITPKVNIIGSGTETTEAVARALVNSTASNSIYRIEILERGANYTYHTATVVANAVVNVESTAALQVIYSPEGGHGYDQARELGAKHLAFVVEISGTESNTIPEQNKFQQVGLLRDPLFANVQLGLTNTISNFSVNEVVLKMNPVRINTNATINTTSAIVSCPTASFTSQVSAGDYLYIADGAGTSQQLGVVNSVTNGTAIELTTNGYFACTETLIYLANTSSFANVISGNSSVLYIDNVSGILQSGDDIIGMSSGAKSTINTVTRNGNTKSFDTFVQLYKYVGTLDSGSFINNETVYQNSIDSANGLLHSANLFSGVLTLYTSNQVGQFDTSNTVIGDNSGAVATISDFYSPELVFGSGEILYLENLEPVTRSANTKETFQFIFEF